MNLAALWKVPALFVCENNQYAMGTALRFTHASTDLVRKGEAYGIPTHAVDGISMRAVIQATDKRRPASARATGPRMLVCETYRFRAHSMFDAELYREKNEVEEWKKRVPDSAQYQQHLALGEQDIKAMDLEVAAEVQRAIDFAEAGTWEPVETCCAM